MIKAAGIFLLCLAFGRTSVAQNLPDLGTTSTPGTATSAPLPATYTNSLTNYTRTWIPAYPVTDPSLLNDNTSLSYIHEATTYIDGTGRPVEKIYWQHYNLTSDYVEFYDNRPTGSDRYDFLPYATGSKSKFRSSPFAEQKSFYDALYPNEASTAYSKASYTSDANGRSLTSTTPGKSTAGQGKGVVETARLNDANEIINWSLDMGTYVPTNVGYYGAGQLKKTIATDANGGSNISYTDKDGNLICTKVLKDNTGSSPVYLTTYFIYDNFRRPVFTISPKAYEKIVANGNQINTSIITGLCNYTRYDWYGRAYQKHIAGQDGDEYVIYDQKNRPVLSRTPEMQNQNQWAFNIYDNAGRVLVTGLLTDNDVNTPSAMQNWFDFGSLPSGYNNSGNLFYFLFNEFATPQYPGVSQLSNGYILTYSYYDNYFDPFFASNSFDASKFYSYTSTAINSLAPDVYIANVYGKLTGRNVRVNNDNGTPNLQPWISEVYYYDKYGHIIQTQSQNAEGGKDYICNQYNFEGNILANIFTTNNPNSTTKPSTVIATIYTYQLYTGLLSSVQQQIDFGTTHNIKSYVYDNLGKVKSKSVGGIETQQYDYNIRGQLTGINQNYAETGSGSNISFGESIKYDYGFTDKQYGGNISGIVWKGSSSTPVRSYGYSYDKAGQLTNASFLEMSSVGGASPAWNNQNADYTVSNLQYDANGNINSMNQRGVAQVNVAGSWVTQVVDLDNLSYVYQNGDMSNRLDMVNDGITTNYNSVDFVDNNPGATDYAYDANGNLTKDLNKNITNITYNYLNLPVTVTFNNNGTIQTLNYYYDANGVKLREAVDDGTSINYTDYVGPVVYHNNDMYYVINDEGRARYHSNTSSVMVWDNDYFIKDHLGNVRNVLTAEEVPISEYLASHEVAAAHLESAVFAGIDAVRGDKPNSTDPADTKAAVLLGSDPQRQIGTTLMLKVMAGDKFDASVSGYYEDNKSGDGIVNAPDLMGSVMSTLLGGNNYDGVPLQEMPENAKIVQQAFKSDELAALYDRISINNTDPEVPAGQLNYLLFDENFRLVSENSGAVQIANGAGQWQQIGTDGQVNINQNGYLVVFISNRSLERTVWMDKLSVHFYRGKLVEENHYYPHGLAVNIGSAAGPLEKKYLYQTEEWRNDLGLMWYDFHARQYDPQIGRFCSNDPKMQFHSGYIGMGNNPVINKDPDGKWIGYDDLIVAAAGFIMGYAEYGIMTGHWGGKALVAGLGSAAFMYLSYNTLGVWAGLNTQTGVLAEGGAFAGEAAVESAGLALEHKDQIKNDDWNSVYLTIGYNGIAAISTGLSVGDDFSQKWGFLGKINYGEIGGAAFQSGSSYILGSAYDADTRKWDWSNVNYGAAGWQALGAAGSTLASKLTENAIDNATSGLVDKMEEKAKWNRGANFWAQTVKLLNSETQSVASNLVGNIVTDYITGHPENVAGEFRQKGTYLSSIFSGIFDYAKDAVTPNNKHNPDFSFIGRF